MSNKKEPVIRGKVKVHREGCLADHTPFPGIEKCDCPRIETETPLSEFKIGPTARRQEQNDKP